MNSIEKERELAAKLAQEKSDVIEKVSKYWYALKEQKEVWRADKDVLLAAVQNDGLALQFGVPKLRGDRDIVLQAVRQKGTALGSASDELRNDVEIVLEAVKQDGWALQCASEEMKATKDIVIEAVRQKGGALNHASEELRGDRDVVLEAVRNDGWSLEYASTELKGVPPREPDNVPARTWKIKIVEVEALAQEANAAAAAVEALAQAERDASGIVETHPQADLEIARAAVEQRGWGKDYLSEELRGAVREKKKAAANAAVANDSDDEVSEEVGRVLKLTIVGAKELRNCDAASKGQGCSDPYCLFYIEGKKETTCVETIVLQDTLFPMWNHVVEVENYIDGEDLVFEVCDKDLKDSEFLGRCEVSHKWFDPQGFDGEVMMSQVKPDPDGRQAKSFMKLKIESTCEPIQLFAGEDKGDYWQCIFNGTAFQFHDDGTAGAEGNYRGGTWSYKDALSIEVTYGFGGVNLLKFHLEDIGRIEESCEAEGEVVGQGVEFKVRFDKLTEADMQEVEDDGPETQRKDSEDGEDEEAD